MNSEADLLKYFQKIKFNYHFDDNVFYGNRQPDTSRTIYHNNIKEFKYGDLIDLIDDDIINKLAFGLPEIVDLRKFITKVYDQLHPFSFQEENGSISSHIDKDLDISVSCCIASCISIRTNYINYQRYRITRMLFGDKIPQIIPSISYINWNANVQKPSSSFSSKDEKAQKIVPPSIISHLISIQSHKIVDVSKYDDNSDKINDKPDLLAFYHASKSLNFKWFKLNQHESTLKIMLDRGYPIIAGIVIYKEMLNLISYQFGIFKIPDYDNELPMGANPITIIGYNDKKKIFFFLNTWSKKWGDQGIGEISYDHLLNPKIAGDFAVLDYQL